MRPRWSMSTMAATAASMMACNSSTECESAAADASDFIIIADIMPGAADRGASRRQGSRDRGDDPGAPASPRHPIGEVRGLYDQHIAGQQIEHPLCRIADEESFEPGARNRAHDYDRAARFFGRLCERIRRVTPDNVSLCSGNPGGAQLPIQGLLCGRSRIGLEALHGLLVDHRFGISRKWKWRVSVQYMLGAAQSAHYSRACREDALIQLRRLGKSVSGVDRSEHHRMLVGTGSLHEQYRYGAQTQQLPIGQVQQTCNHVLPGMLIRDDEVGLDPVGTSYDGLVDGKIPFSRNRDLDPVMPQSLRHLFQLCQDAHTHHALDLRKLDAEGSVTIDILRRRDAVKELNPCTQRAGKLRALDEGGASLRFIILDRDENAPEGAHDHSPAIGFDDSARSCVALGERAIRIFA